MEIIKSESNYTPIADGQTGSAVAATLNNALSATYGVVRYKFSASDVQSETVSGVTQLFVSVTHSKNTMNVQATLYDASGVKQNIDGLFSLPNANSWRLNIYASIAEVFELVVNYLPEKI